MGTNTIPGQGDYSGVTGHVLPLLSVNGYQEWITDRGTITTLKVAPWDSCGAHALHRSAGGIMIQRYDRTGCSDLSCMCGGTMEPCDDGEYVLWDDVAPLLVVAPAQQSGGVPPVQQLHPEIAPTIMRCFQQMGYGDPKDGAALAARVVAQLSGV